MRTFVLSVFIYLIFLPIILAVYPRKIAEQQTVDNAKRTVFDRIIRKLITNAGFDENLYVPFNSILNNSYKCNTTFDNFPSNIQVINLSGKHIKAVWIDYQGKESTTQFLSGNLIGSIFSFGQRSNFCYRVYLNVNDSESDSFYLKIPNNTQTYIWGNVSNLYNDILNSSWLDNADIEHLTKYEILVDLDRLKANSNQSVAEYQLLRTTYYEDSVEMNSKLDTFFKSFNQTKKYVDAFFNPMNSINQSYYVIRAGDYKANLPLSYYSIEYFGPKFAFTVLNDLDADFNLYKIQDQQKPLFLERLQINASTSYECIQGQVFMFNSKNRSLLMKVGEYPFNESHSNVSLSLITVILDLEIEKIKYNSTNSAIFDALNYSVEYNSKQGRIGDCYILADLISIYSRYPEQIVSKFIKPQQMADSGIVAVKLWCKNRKKWRLEIMDDYLPYLNSSWFGASTSGSFHNLFWQALLEKAFAKQIKNYINLAGRLRYLNTNLVYEMLLGPFLNESRSVIFSNESSLDLFLDYYRNGSIISFASKSKSINESTNNSNCIVRNHAYGLLDLKVNVANSGFTFVKVQNPWLHNGEWCGDWDSKSALWKRYQDVEAVLKPDKKNDGIFWIEKKDLSKAFSRAMIASVNIKMG